MTSESAGKRHEYFGVLLFLVTALLCLCLLSYNPRDSSFNALFYKVSAENKAGKGGAYVSDFLLPVRAVLSRTERAPRAWLIWRDFANGCKAASRFALWSTSSRLLRPPWI